MQLSPAVQVRLLLSLPLSGRGGRLQLQVGLRPQLREGVPIAWPGLGHGQIVQDSLLGQCLAVVGGQAQQGVALVHQLSIEHRLEIQVLLQGLQSSKDSPHSVVLKASRCWQGSVLHGRRKQLIGVNSMSIADCKDSAAEGSARLGHTCNCGQWAQRT